jgi:hypothetical protein
MTILSHIKDITIDQIKQWDFILKTPANRHLYYNKPLDVVGYISSDGGKAVIYYNRIMNGNAAYSFCEHLKVNK